MHADAAEIARPYARKTRFVTAKHLDRRTVAARKAASLVKEFTAQLTAAFGSELSFGQLMQVERAAMLAACAEDIRVRCLAGDPSVNLDDLVRVDNIASRAIAGLGLDRKREPARGGLLAALLRERQGGGE